MTFSKWSICSEAIPLSVFLIRILSRSGISLQLPNWNSLDSICVQNKVQCWYRYFSLTATVGKLCKHNDHKKPQTILYNNKSEHTQIRCRYNEISNILICYGHLSRGRRAHEILNSARIENRAIRESHKSIGLTWTKCQWNCFRLLKHILNEHHIQFSHNAAVYYQNFISNG